MVRVYGVPAVERAMRMYEVILRAMSGELTWLQAARVLGKSPRSLRRWKARWEKHGHSGLLDQRLGRPSPRRAAIAETERILRLYRERYLGFNVRHFHEIVRREHAVGLSYSFVRNALQKAGLVRKRRARGRHRLRREARACFGEMLHLDGSEHAWLALRPDEKQTLIAVVDDATKRLLYAQLAETESTETVMIALRQVMVEHGVPMALYTDRASWAAWTPKAGGPVDKSRPTQVGRALARLGVEHILAYSPQARGRGERLNRTLQDRLVNELRVAKIGKVPSANRYLERIFIPRYNEAFGRTPKEPGSAFVALGAADIEQILCHEEQRTVGKDNIVLFDSVCLQLRKLVGHRSCAGWHVLARRHLDGSYSVWRGPQLLALYDDKARWIEPAAQAA
jgi:transposase